MAVYEVLREKQVLTKYIFYLVFSMHLLDNTALKGQCHEIVSEMSPWSSSLGLNEWSRTFFCLKIRRLKATVCRVPHPLM
jgi:hypothetical protein